VLVEDNVFERRKDGQIAMAVEGGVVACVAGGGVTVVPVAAWEIVRNSELAQAMQLASQHLAQLVRWHIHAATWENERLLEESSV
jgi:hypothetical protein